MSREVLLWEALVGAAVKIMHLRKDKVESKDMEEILTFISGERGQLRMLLFGMMTDAAEATLELLRYFDTEAYDSALMTSKIAKLANTLKWAFTDGKAATTEGTYTSIMLKHIAKQRTIVIRNLTYVIGSDQGIMPEMLQQALARMNSFVVLAVATLRAEFPEWEMLQSFAPFDLSGEPSCGNHTDLRRIAQVFKLDAAALVKEYKMVLPNGLQG